MASSLAAHADFDMSSAPNDDVEFTQWVELLSQRIGLRDAHIRRSFLDQCISRCMQKCGARSRRDYFELLSDGSGGEKEWEGLIQLLPLHETRFMRHESSLRLVREYVSRAARNPARDGQALTLWSAGCSTGEEVYSLAITALDSVADAGSSLDVRVIGSDLCRSSLEVGRKGVYSKRQMTNLGAAQIEKYFDPSDGETYMVNSRLRNVVQFVPINLVEERSDTGYVGMVDVAFCQNVLIYFDNDTRVRVCNRIAEHVLPGGLLVLGAGEILRWNHAQLKRAGGDDTLAYQKLSTVV